MIVIDRGDGIEAALLGYSMPLEPEPTDAFGDVARPLIELENEALGTWYLNAIATFPEARGRGHATCLLGLAEGLAHEAGNTTISLITSDTNAEARRLYQRHGYRVTDSRPIVQGSWNGDGTEWLLFVKEL
ncbi:GNAT family N-acetyltransferase [Defluviimonas sp. WL0050]|uniref:GNAT family N-acetyltransferase n=1 Tax=Albidovulum litorale TaxID=2984134 RepID=A0ABT2ZQK0_9RHOB|nr:GNAT family N-acetyltransferase [Defluviimonas sp. WL0050]MCV2873269.1 GNAT family N-acetyltransferase [Defluviimonas sp. WL0050]